MGARTIKESPLEFVRKNPLSPLSFEGVDVLDKDLRGQLVTIDCDHANLGVIRALEQTVLPPEEDVFVF